MQRWCAGRRKRAARPERSSGAAPAFRPAAERAWASASRLFQVDRARRERGVGEVGEDAVDAGPEEVQVLQRRVAAVLAGQVLLLVAEGVAVHEQAGLV